MASARVNIVRSPWFSRGNQSGVHAEPLDETFAADNSSTWIKGQLLTLSSGVLAAVESSAGGGAGNAGIVDTDDIAAGSNLYLAGDDLAVAASTYEPVIRIRENMRMIGFLATSDATATTVATAPTSIVGSQYGLYQTAAGIWAVDKNTTSKALVEITRVQSQLFPATDAEMYENSDDEVYNLVEFKFLSTVLTD